MKPSNLPPKAAWAWDILTALVPSELLIPTEVSKRVLNNEQFCTWSGAPAAHLHHYGKHGLLIHTAELMEYAWEIFKIEKRHHRDLSWEEIYYSILYHDYGKIYDYRPTNEELTEWESTPHKLKIYHISRSSLYWNEVARSVNLDQSFIDRVTHNILAHHQRLEWKSPVSPQTREAWVVHLVDMLSARLTDCGSRPEDGTK